MLLIVITVIFEIVYDRFLDRMEDESCMLAFGPL